MNSTCLYKNPQKIVCQQVDWCLIDSATLLSVSIIARDGVAECDIQSMTELEIRILATYQQHLARFIVTQRVWFSLDNRQRTSINSSAVQCIFKFKDSTLYSTVTICNASIMVCDVPSWGLHFAAQTALVSFASDGFTAPLAVAVALEFLSSVSSLHPSVQSIYGGTLLFIDGSGLDVNSAKQLSCVFLQAAFRSMTPSLCAQSGSGSCSTPFWTAANLANRSYEVWLNYRENCNGTVCRNYKSCIKSIFFSHVFSLQTSSIMKIRKRFAPRTKKTTALSSNKYGAIESARAKYKLDEVPAEIAEYFRHRHPKYRREHHVHQLVTSCAHRNWKNPLGLNLRS